MGNVETVQAIYQSFSKGEVPAILEKLHDKVSWEHDAIDHGIPWLKPGRGKLHVHQFFNVVGREFEISKFETKATFENGKDVIVLIEIEARIRSTRKPIKDLEFHIWSFDQEGKVKAFRHVVDTHQHFLASKR
jgi:ketosteroid isomerase-like protein